MLVTYFVNFRLPNDHLFGKELFIRFTAIVFCKLLSVYVFSYFPFGFEGRMWDLIVLVPDHCLFFYFTLQQPRPRFCCGSYTHISCSVRVKDLYSSMNQNSEHINQDSSLR